MAAYISEKRLREAVSDRLQLVGVSEFPQHLNGVVRDAVRAVTAWIDRELTARGLTPAQIAAWQSLEDFALRGGVCYVFEHGGIARDYDTRHLERVCSVKEEIKTVPLVVGGAVAAGSVGRGRLSTADDFFGDPEEMKF